MRVNGTLSFFFWVFFHGGTKALIHYHSRSGFHHHRQFLSVHLICSFFACSFYFLFAALLYYIAHIAPRNLTFRFLEYCSGQLMEDGAI